jgi:class 3 adenylate cyclase
VTSKVTPDSELAELRRELQSAELREAAVRDVVQTIAQSSFDLEVVLQTVIDRAVELCQAENGNIARLEGDVYRVVAFHAFSPEYEHLVRERDYVPERASLLGRTVLERRVVHIHDVLEDPEYELQELQKAGGYRTALGVPMLRDGAVVGAIAVARNQVRPFSDAEIRLLETFADHVVVAIENVRLFETVERQRTELARFAPQVADLLSTDEGEQLLSGHRREITALFCDLRGFTAFAETAEPEEVLGVLREYHEAVGELVTAHGGTVEHFAGDGLMAFFNDPTPVRDHQLAAVRTAVAINERFGTLSEAWGKRGYDLGLGIGVATGYATLGRIGFEGRYDYGAIGNAVILAARLSDAAAPGEILLAQRTQAALDERVPTERIDGLELKGFSRPVNAVRLDQRELAVGLEPREADADQT